MKCKILYGPFPLRYNVLEKGTGNMLKYHYWPFGIVASGEVDIFFFML